MTPRGDASVATGSLAGGIGVILIALVYGVVGPLVGAVLLSPLGALVKGQEMPYALLGGLLLLVENFPTSAALAYYSAGLLALCTGVIVAVVARRRGAVPLQMAGLAAVRGSPVFRAVCTDDRICPSGGDRVAGSRRRGARPSCSLRALWLRWRAVY